MGWARAGRLLGGLLLLLLVGLLSLANAPAPWWACNGKSVGDSCEPYDYAPSCLHDDPRGVCQLRKPCTDNPETAVNECLDCVE